MHAAQKAHFTVRGSGFDVHNGTSTQ